MDGLDYCDGCGAKLVAPVTVTAGDRPVAANAPSSVGPGAPSPAESPHVEPINGTPDKPTVATSDEGQANRMFRDTSSQVPTVESAIAAEPEPPPPAASPQAPTGEIKAPEPAPAPALVTPTAGTHFHAKLALIRGGRKGQEFPLEDGKNLIGRWDPEPVHSRKSISNRTTLRPKSHASTR